MFERYYAPVVAAPGFCLQMRLTVMISKIEFDFVPRVEHFGWIPEVAFEVHDR